MKDQLGNLPFDVTIEPYTLPTHPSYPHRVEVTQSSREIIFVPSGWHHQVHNLETTLSVNHNWFNGCNAEKCWNYLKYNLQLVEKEISEFKDSMTDWESHCQVLLRAHMGFHFEDFIEILIHIANKRLGMNRPQVFDLVALRDMFRQIANVNSSRRTTIETLVKEINKTLQYYI
ncbi:JMJD4 [Bugula neritina]|uniref:Jumonji domain-containing protein 4 n=1 Tax=Bugula neritina TaxID=10212 RepID=A0A7J7JZ84_BUGNE|nr:JMJD4 [Bugula neritina]